jgi:hypothetical protein
MVKLSFPACPPTPGTRPYENVCKSKGVPRTEKTAYLRALTVCGKDLACAKKTHEKHRHGKARTGPKANDLDPYEGLGALVPENKFIERTAAAFGRSIKDFSNDVRNWVRYHEKKARGDVPTETERLVVFKFMRARCLRGRMVRFGYFEIQADTGMPSPV